MKVKVFRKVGFFKSDEEIVYCDRVGYRVEKKQFTAYINEQVSAYISNATGYVVINTDKGHL
tara:strand:- start:1419 stop:1604 length:186 start_codon:yes stop_codon:yes gene_type:complete